MTLYSCIIILLYIIALGTGLLLGNFTTSLLYRLPRGINICGFDKNNTQPPLCSYCNHRLKFYEFLPLLSCFFAATKCNYCQYPISKKYLALEIFGAVISAICLYLFDFSDLYVIVVIFGLLSLLNYFIYIEHGYVSMPITISICTLGIIFNVLLGTSFLSVITAVIIAGVPAIAIMQKFGFYNKEARIFCHVIFLIMWFISSIYYGVIYVLFVISIYLCKRFSNRDIKTYSYCIVFLFVITFIHITKTSFHYNIEGCCKCCLNMLYKKDNARI